MGNIGKYLKIWKNGKNGKSFFSCLSVSFYLRRRERDSEYFFANIFNIFFVAHGCADNFMVLSVFRLYFGCTEGRDYWAIILNVLISTTILHKILIYKFQKSVQLSQIFLQCRLFYETFFCFLLPRIFQRIWQNFQYFRLYICQPV